MGRVAKGDRAFMSKMGVSRLDFQDVLIAQVPRGIESVQAAQGGGTPMVAHFKGFFQGMVAANKILNDRYEAIGPMKKAVK